MMHSNLTPESRAQIPVRLRTAHRPTHSTERLPGEQALRLVLAVALERDAAAALLGVVQDDVRPVVLWPSTLYRLVARTALLTPEMWLLVKGILDRRLAPWMEHYESTPPARIVESFANASRVAGSHDLVSLLWALLRRREPALTNIVERLAEETEIGVFRSSFMSHDRSS